MDWIEQLFGISPDGGDGSFEALILAIIVAVAVVSLARVVRRRVGGRRRLP